MTSNGVCYAGGRFTNSSQNYFVAQYPNTTGLSHDPHTTISIYPNPANDYLKIQSDEALASPAIRIFNLTGQLVCQQNIIDDNTVSVQGLSKGNYLLEVITQKTIMRSRFVKD